MHDGSEAHSSFVQGLKEVGEDHNCKDTLVYQPFESFVVFRSNFNLECRRILGHFWVDSIMVGIFLGGLIRRDDALNLIKLNRCRLGGLLSRHFEFEQIQKELVLMPKATQSTVYLKFMVS
jgi:hypothetical protein